MNTNTQALRECDIELLKVAREFPDNFFPGIIQLIRWLKEGEHRNPFEITVDEINSIMEQHPDTAPFFTAVLEAKEAGRI